MASFNDYLKYVKGHSMDFNGIISFIDRFITAIDRRAIEGTGGTLYITKINPSYKTEEATLQVNASNSGQSYEIYVDLYNMDICVSNVIKNLADDYFEDFSKFSISKTQIKTKIKMDLTGIIDPLYIYDDDDEEYLNANKDEAVSYAKNGIDTIGKNNVKANICIIFIIKILEFFKAFDAIENAEEDIPEEYQSTEPGDPAHLDDGNTKADKSAESYI